MNDQSLDQWIERLNDGDAEAVERILMAYEPYLRVVVRRKIGHRLRAKVDSVDIVQSVFANVLNGFRNGGWRFSGRPQLRAFLRQIAWRRLADRYQEHRKVLDKEQSLSDTLAFSLPEADTPRPSQVVEGREFWERVLAACPQAHREIVLLRVNGFQLNEIAERTGLHEGSVRRILYDLARRLSVPRRTAQQTCAIPGAQTEGSV
jgi:RNA polymerase sigma-70 factor (ECF subfamily)